MNLSLTEDSTQLLFSPPEYLEDDCQPFYYSNETGESWDKRVKYLEDNDSRLYGYVQPTRDNVYRGPLNCAIKVTLE